MASEEKARGSGEKARGAHENWNAPGRLLMYFYHGRRGISCVHLTFCPEATYTTTYYGRGWPFSWVIRSKFFMGLKLGISWDLNWVQSSKDLNCAGLTNVNGIRLASSSTYDIWKQFLQIGASECNLHNYNKSWKLFPDEHASSGTTKVRWL